MKSAMFAMPIRGTFIGILIFGGGFAWSLVAQEANPIFIYLVVVAVSFLALSVYLVVSLIVGFVSWKKTSRWWFVPCLTAVGFISCAPLFLRLGSVVDDWTFGANIQEYSRIVDDIRNGAVPCNRVLGPVPEKALPLNVRKVLAARYSDGSTIVLFLVGTGFPVYHTGYLFDGSNNNIECITQFKLWEGKYSLRHVIGGWYHFSG